MKDNAQRFLSAFAQIEKHLRVLAGETRYEKFYRLLEECSKRNKIVRHYEFNLQEYADLRNAIVHQRDGEGRVIAQPTDEVVIEIEKILKLLTQAPMVSQFFLKKVYVCEMEDSILKVQEIMQKEGYSKVPVVSNREVIGLVHIEEIAKWACDKLRTKGADEKVSAIMQDTHKQRNTVFVSKDTSVYGIPELFTQGLKNGQKLDAVFVTETGSAKEKVIGIITVKDLPLILEYF